MELRITKIEDGKVDFETLYHITMKAEIEKTVLPGETVSTRGNKVVLFQPGCPIDSFMLHHPGVIQDYERNMKNV